jgi:hypothetical protein
MAIYKTQADTFRTVEYNKFLVPVIIAQCTWGRNLSKMLTKTIKTAAVPREWRYSRPITTSAA